MERIRGIDFAWTTGTNPDGDCSDCGFHECACAAYSVEVTMGDAGKCPGCGEWCPVTMNGECVRCWCGFNQEESVNDGKQDVP